MERGVARMALEPTLWRRLSVRLGWFDFPRARDFDIPIDQPHSASFVLYPNESIHDDG
jgi:hypothetical protein